MSDDYEEDDYEESGSLTPEGDLSDDGLSGNEDVDFSDEEEGFDVPVVVRNTAQFWKAPISGVSISFGGQPAQVPQPSFTPQIYAPQAPTANQALFAPQQSFAPQAPTGPVFEILPSPQMQTFTPQYSYPPQVPSTAPTQQQPITFETVGRNLIVRSLPEILIPYQTYLQSLYGKYDEATNVWTFSQRQEARVRELLGRIASGQLPPPDQLPLPSQEMSIDVSTVGELPVRIMAPPAPVAPESQQTEAAPTAPPQPLRQAAPPPPVNNYAPPGTTYLPSQIIQATMPTSIAPSPQPSVMGGQPQPAPPYDPTTKESSESQQEYERRLLLYRHLSNLGVASESSDLLSRMRNQVDIHGATYEPSAMQILNTYLPLSQ